MGEAVRNIDANTKIQPKATQPQTPPAFSIIKQDQAGSDAFQLVGKLSKALNSSPQVLSKYMRKQMEVAADLSKDPLNMKIVLSTIKHDLSLHPEWIIQESVWRMNRYGQLWMYAWAKAWGFSPAPIIAPIKGDNRFRNENWTKQLWFDCTKQAYLLWAESLQRLTSRIETTDPLLKKRIMFYTKLYVDSLSPTNFAFTNPEVLAKTYSTMGENLIDGYMNFLRDVERGHGNLAMTTADMNFFEVGKNLAITAGKVVYQNDLMQLIQYEPTTATVASTPVLVTPAWINKYYILDLQQKNSYVKHMVDQGFTVFAISWVNPSKELSSKKFEDYMLEGPVEAIEQIKKITGESRVNMVGYCLGGTLTATTAAYLAALGERSVNSLTLLTTLTDFSEPGDLQVFIDPKQVSALEEKMTARGWLEAEEMTAAFNLLRSNELIWQTMMNNYMLAKPPIVLDFLAWNADATRMPAEMHRFYLRKMYVENALKKPGGITLDGTPIDLSKVTCPVYQISAKEDHIAPWKSTYAGTQLFSGRRRFVLSESGHIAGVVNPPANKKYNHWVNEDLPADPEKWFEGAKYTTGSWWDDWSHWIADFAGKNQVPARVPGAPNEEGYASEVIEDAPGSYVKMRAV